LLIVAPSSQELEPPTIPARFRISRMPASHPLLHVTAVVIYRSEFNAAAGSRLTRAPKFPTVQAP
jgi:hypothetical protein